ncbi:MAG TPA: type IV toxin-antitoxin system AbiEi family antitoxin domain-containing protein, partial [Ilumatobacteraceae bacterium]|nr:type IV toxin-antitoxin system AbiEi family antitoxin domain-containing protein [Ilumatobacteraceae bacterium]
MDPRFAQITALAVKQHSAISLTQVQQLGVSRALCSQWVRVGLLERAGPRSFVVAGSAPTWKRALATAQFDLDGVGAFAGRAGAFAPWDGRHPAR